MNTFRTAFCWVLLAMTATASSGLAREDVSSRHVSRWDDNAGPHLLSALPTTDRTLNGYHKSELLVLTFYQSDLDFAVDADSDGLDGKVHNAHYAWDPAYRGTWGIHGVNTGWDLHFQHTHACQKISKRVQANSGFLGPVLWLDLDNANEAMTASFSGKIDYTLLDLVASHSFFVNEHLAVTPMGGLRCGLVCQEQRAVYEGGDFSSGSSAGSVNYKSDFCGWGLVMGGSMDYYLGKGFSMVTRGAISVLATMHEWTLKHRKPDESGMPVDVEEMFCNMRSSLETALGFSWEKEDPFQYCRYLQLGFGYELHHWINVDRPRRITNGSDGSHLGWWGFAFSGRLDF